MGKSKVKKYRISRKDTQTGRIEENLKILELKGALAVYKTLADNALREERTPLEFLEQLLESEINLRESNRIERRIKQAQFEFLSTSLQEYNFLWPKRIDRRKVNELSSCRFLENAENVIFLGPTGLGKTHLAQGLALEAIYQGKDARFLPLRHLKALVDKVSDSSYETRKLINFYSRQDLLIIDEVALSTSNKAAVDFINEIVISRHHKRSTIFTSNKTVEAWTDTFGDSHTTAMILDRITEHCHIIKIEGLSYRGRKLLLQ